MHALDKYCNTVIESPISAVKIEDLLVSCTVGPYGLPHVAAPVPPGCHCASVRARDAVSMFDVLAQDGR